MINGRKPDGGEKKTKKKNKQENKKRLMTIRRQLSVQEKASRDISIATRLRIRDKPDWHSSPAVVLFSIPLRPWYGLSPIQRYRHHHHHHRHRLYLKSFFFPVNFWNMASVDRYE